MLFNSLAFLCFFAVVLILFHRAATWRGRKALLLFASYSFYGAWNPPFVALLWISTAIDWIASHRMDPAGTPAQRRPWLLLSLATNLGMLGYFKYGDFVLENFLRVVGWSGPAPESGIVLPVGISFYTFQTLSYTIDVYRGRTRPARSLLDFALYVSFFPQLVAGPIVRSDSLLPQLERRTTTGANSIAWGAFLITLGLFEKVVLADGLLSGPADTVFAGFAPVSTLDAWLGVLAFSGQIFCDFAGYSTCAVGAAVCFGLHLPENFKCPYSAVGFREFWRRWHISFSTWLRDYVYIPLGGSREGRLRTVGSVGATMLLGGLWHGASWTFVAWGAVHGLLLLVERALRAVLPGGRWRRAPGVRFSLWAVTFVVTSVAWVLFRASDFPTAALVLASLAGVLPGEEFLATPEIVQVSLVMLAILVVQWRFRDYSFGDLGRALPPAALGGLWVVMLVSLILTQGAGDAFLYFQF